MRRLAIISPPAYPPGHGQPVRASDLISDLLATGITRSQIAQRTGLSPG